MSNGNHKPGFTAAGIEKYRTGKLTPAERHAMEKAALEDPFLADALEGYEHAGANPEPDLAELRSRLAQREQEARVLPLAPVAAKSYTWLKVAAMAVIVFGAAFLVYRLGSSGNSPGIALQDEATSQIPVDSLAKTQALQDSSPAQGLTPDQGSATALSPGTSAEAIKPSSGKSTLGGNAGSPAVDKSELSAAKDRVDPPVVSRPARSQVNDDGVPDAEASVAAPVAGKPTEEEIIAKKEQYKADEKEKARLLLANAGAKTRNSEQVIGYGTTNRAQFVPNTFRGRVLDVNNNALPFVNITNAQDNVGTYTDARGNFVLTSPDSILDVRVKSLGFESQAVELKPNAPATGNKIVLSEADNVSAVVISRQKVNSARPRSSTTLLEDAEPLDGWRNYDTYIANNLQVPETDKGRPTQTGEVELSFEVDKKGEPVNITVVRSLCESCDREAIRLLKEGPKWKRKARQGRTSVTIPF